MQLNWRYALAEVSLIFVGITAAIVFDEWREEQARRDLERELLSEIRADLRETRRDLHKDLERLARQLEATRRIATALASSRRYEEAERDLMLTAFTGALRPKTSGYTALLNRGLDVLGDPGLRKAITDLHELTLPRIADVESIAYDRIAPYVDTLASHLHANDNIPWRASSTGGVGFLISGDTYRIADWSRLCADPGVQFRLLQIYGPRAGVQAMYLRTNAEIDALVARIDAFLAGEPAIPGDDAGAAAEH
jgi:predicted house-cleaning noncanonical NTP pyrophosphatase (MazG superfamily)